MAEFELKALITGVDRLSPALSKMQKKIRGFKRRGRSVTGWAGAWWRTGCGFDASLKSYADQKTPPPG